MNPCARNRDNSRRATRCSRCRWTRSAVRRPGVPEGDRAHWGLLPPVGQLLLGLAGSAERVERRFPAAPVGERWKLPEFRRVLVRPAFQRIGPQDLKGTGERVAERFFLEPNPLARPGEQVPALVVRRFESVLSAPRGVEFRFADPSAGGIDVRFLDPEGELPDLPVADALSEPSFDVVLDHLREAAEFALNRFRFAHQNVEHPVLRALGQLEVAAAHFRRGLELAVNAPVALLDTAGVPRQVEVEEVGAVGLEVQSLPGGIGGEQDAERIFCRRGVEAPLDLAAAGAGDEAVNRLDPLGGALGPRDGRLQDVPQVTLRAFPVLGEDQDAAVVPAGGRADGGVSVGR